VAEPATIEELREWTGYEQEARIVAWLDQHGVNWWRGKDGRPCTTWTAINASLQGERKSVGF
jgi:hypothetical protein